ncbi:unnamed protein product [Paramecium octaurelia]|uniref:Uncharacterized protein n=1 Tax=Paramecium octaurelia TaxID=43137 RepID=A0A8S1T0M4_PAROT|nr:unnamed protein product [Paramecium octaurelia]
MCWKSNVDFVFHYLRKSHKQEYMQCMLTLFQYWLVKSIKDHIGLKKLKFNCKLTLILQNKEETQFQYHQTIQNYEYIQLQCHKFNAMLNSNQSPRQQGFILEIFDYQINSNINAYSFQLQKSLIYKSKRRELIHQ